MELIHQVIYPFLLDAGKAALTPDEQELVNDACQRFDDVLKVSDLESPASITTRLEAVTVAFCEAPSKKAVELIKTTAGELASAAAVQDRIIQACRRVGELQGQRIAPILIRVLRSNQEATDRAAADYKKTVAEKGGPLGLPVDSAEVDGRLARNAAATESRIDRLLREPGAAFEELEKLRIGRNVWFDYFAG